ncbi:MAG: hypothetical protein H0T71_13110 [Acidobacteria bacterium]|nr:hypothetical protein [Acidobacteriota bacterium]
MEPRPLRIGSLVEWVVAAAAVLALIWLISVPVQRALGPRVEAALVDAPPPLPPGVPEGATNVPVMLLLDGRVIRHGDLHARLNQLLPEKFAAGGANRSTGEFGERHTRAYVVDGVKFYVVCERMEPNGPLRIAGVYLP